MAWPDAGSIAWGRGLQTHLAETAREPSEAVALSVERPLLQSCSRDRVRKCQVTLGSC